jgi:hypothetical protein
VGGSLQSRARGLLAAVIFTLSCAPAPASPAREPRQGGPIDAGLARRYFDEALAACGRDGGRLWGESLCGPMMFADPSTHAVVASAPDGEGILKRSGGVFVGTLPATVNVSNTSLTWAGVNWMVVIASAIPGDGHRRATLFIHELWHRKQEELGFPPSGAANNHLDTREGRVWLRLEWRALAAALKSRGRERLRAVSDALLFRAYRRSLFPGAAAEERGMEMHEGLAEYTGVRLGGSPAPSGYVADVEIVEAAERESFVRSFAYASGPAYGLLLDDAAPGWTRKLHGGDDLGSLLRARLRLRPVRDIRRNAFVRARPYGGAALMASEGEREEKRQRLLADYRKRLVEGPVLVIPLKSMRMSFDPGNLVPLDALGTVYPNIRVVDAWGILTVSRGGALMSAAYSSVNVPAPPDAGIRPVRGEGWTLELNEGWTLALGPRRGDLTIKELR